MNRAFKIIGLIFCLLVLSCIKTPSKYNFDALTAGKGEWNIDELKVTWIVAGSEIIEADTTFYDHGYFKFFGSKNYPEYELQSTIPLNMSTFGPLEGFDVEIYGSNLLFLLDSTSTMSFLSAEIIQLDRNEMILFCPSSLNTVIDGPHDLDFYFKCSKK